MLSLTRKADYAVVAMADLAHRGASKTSARDIAERTGVPLPVLTNILHQLLHRGLVNSALGSKGGYWIAKPPSEISLAAVIDAIEGPFRLTLCCGGEAACEGDDGCELEEDCAIKESVRRVHESLRRFLDQVSMAQIAFGSVSVGLNVPAGVENQGPKNATVAATLR